MKILVIALARLCIFAAAINAVRIAWVSYDQRSIVYSGPAQWWLETWYNTNKYL